MLALARLAAEAARRAPLPRLHPRGRDAPDGRAARAARRPARRRDRAPLRRPASGWSPASSGSSCRGRSTRSTTRSAASRRRAPTSASRRAQSTGIKHDILVGLQRRLDDLPSGEQLVDPAVEVTLTVFEVGLGIFFVLASAAYWIFERDRAEDLLCSLLPRPKRKRVRDTWELIDAKLGAYVRGQARADRARRRPCCRSRSGRSGCPYWLLIGAFAGLVEIIPVIGPLAAGRARGRGRPDRLLADRARRWPRRARRAAAGGLPRDPAAARRRRRA